MTATAFAEARNRQRPSDRAAKLLLCRSRYLAESILGGYARRTVNVKGAAVKVSRAGLGYGVNYAAGGAAKLGVITGCNDLELLDGAQRNSKSLIGAFTAA